VGLRELLSTSQREAFEAIPLDRADLIKHYILSAQDLSLIRRRRGAQNRLGLAVQLALLRFPGRALLPDETPAQELLSFVARQLRVPVTAWSSYAERDETRREHLAELQLHYGLKPFRIGQYRALGAWLFPTALQTNRGMVLVGAAIEELRRQSVIIPRLAVLERLCAEVIVRSERQLFQTLTIDLTEAQRMGLDALLKLRDGSKVSAFTWLRSPPGAPTTQNILLHIERLLHIRSLELPPDLGQSIHQNRLLQLAREGAATTPQHLARFDDPRRHGTLTNSVPEEASVLMRRAYALLPHIKITDLLLEVDRWTGFSQHFTHIKTGEPAKDRILLLTAILADGINLGISKMAEACPGTTARKLDWLASLHIRDEAYTKALAELVNHHHRHSFSEHWGEGTTSSSDGQRYRASGRGEQSGQVNLRYGNEPGVLFYTHISDQYTPFYTKVIAANARDATHVLDGLLYHESDLRIEEHYTDTGGFTDHVFALCHLLGFRFAPRIRDLADKRLYVPGRERDHPTLAPLIGGRLNPKLVQTQWEEILRLAASIRHGTVTASLIIRKLASYPRQNSLHTALREVGRIERTLFMLEWMKDPELRRRVQVGLNKGEARNALARAVFFNRQGEMRDRSFENQRYRASGLNLIVAAIILWNTVYLERAIAALREHGISIEDEALVHLSPIGWEHINLTGDYTWQAAGRLRKGSFRPLRPFTASNE
jgi:TnpA family transposase